MKKLITFLFFLVFPFFVLFSQENESLSFYTYRFNSFNDVFYSPENICDDFVKSKYFNGEYTKLKFFSELNAFYNSQKDLFYKVEFINSDENFEVIFYLNNGEKFYFPTGKKEKGKNYTSNFYNYKKGTEKMEHSGIYFFGKGNYDFFLSVYGKNNTEVHDNLSDVNIFGKVLPFNSKNNASANLQKAVNEIENVSKEDKNINDWKKSLYISTYSNRNVANENRPSMHSFGIAVDFVPKRYSKDIYWLWSAEFIGDWWDISDADKINVPQKVVDIFEKYGFCWGGKWFRFDMMHFEYRPEIVSERIY
jgi:hypothetical protein